MKVFYSIAIYFTIFLNYIYGVPPDEPTHVKSDLSIVVDVNSLRNLEALKSRASNVIIPTRTRSPLHATRDKAVKQQRPAVQTTEKHVEAVKKMQSINGDIQKQSASRRFMGAEVSHTPDNKYNLTPEEKPRSPTTFKTSTSTTASTTTTTPSTTTKPSTTTPNSTTTETQSTTRTPSTTTISSTTNTPKKATRLTRRSTFKRKPTSNSMKLRKDNNRPSGLKSGRSRLNARRDDNEEMDDANNSPNFRGQSTNMMDGEPSIQDIPLSPYTLRSRLEEILDLPKYSDLEAKIEVLTKTSEYNEVIMVTLSSNCTEKKARMRSRADKYVEEEPKKKTLMIVHGLNVLGIRHIPALSMEKKFITLLDYYIKHLDKFNFYLIPMANPDGFQRTLSDPKWAKNVSPQEDCLGVALDKNFEVGWNISRKVSSCSQNYPGANAFSEPESMAIRDILHFHSTDIYAYIHVHAASPGPGIFKGDALLTAPGFAKTLSNDDRYVDFKGDALEGLRNATLGNAAVSIETMHKWYGPVSGSSADYAAMVYGIPFGLEMLMQAYYLNDFNLNENGGVDIQDVALTKVWKKMIDITFKSLYKSLKKCQKEKQDDAEANS